MGAIANTIAIVVIVCVGYLIIKKVYPTAVLMIAGLVLLCCAVLLDVEPGLALKKGTGSEFFDIFKIIQDVFSTTLGGLGLNIMCMGGFAKYMDKLEAGRSLYDVAVRRSSTSRIRICSPWPVSLSISCLVWRFPQLPVSVC